MQNPNRHPNGAHDNAPTVKTVIVPAAGMGTRFLPATKTVPKELLPVVDTPGIELIAEEAAQAGASRLAIITAPGKAQVMGHFGSFEHLCETLRARGKDEQAEKVERAQNIITAVSVIQEEPLGLGHAVGCAESVLEDDEDAVAVMLPDDLVLPADDAAGGSAEGEAKSVMEKMVEVRNALGGSVLCAFMVPQDEVSNYGVFDVAEVDPAAGFPADEVKRVVGMVEKPDAADAPSNYVATGRYLLDRGIFDALRRITPGKGGELQLTDAIELMISEGHPVHVVVHHGGRHDLGNPGGYIPANVDFGLRDPKYGPGLYKAIKQIISDYEKRQG
ncbi:UTP--glucose-1-phosphate uridylyltransferase [Corynebacterium aquatimens]|uniref:UTP--glucose-1-phosphate uridylyltransferase n=1 Tax=Corynebacterium aquatimens TaxID=1190508 RepID=A0A931E040_9CORY|nr:UTP--glucose-1-phosphate uridylyltransferase [Corynebacterium aquatimens]MBG6121135.1 UTP--glucose-1-phosphate uridylyltransferase [Corynebacterium aquatimens]WJY66310.1 UTP--glucose-1-phosphate uridylyltransferase [Corynebacterium aquatimens]